MAKKYDLVVATGQYQKDGVDKTQWLNIGKILEKKDGGFVMKLDCTPTSIVNRDGDSVAWDGWVQMFEAKPREQAQQPAQKQADPIAQAGGNSGAPDGGFDDIPFIDPYKFIRLMV